MTKSGYFLIAGHVLLTRIKRLKFLIITNGFGFEKFRCRTWERQYDCIGLWIYSLPTGFWLVTVFTVALGLKLAVTKL